MCLPEGWHQVSQQELNSRGVPADVILVFQADVPISGQFTTITVTRETLLQPITAPEYSDASVLSVQGLPGYEQVDEQSVEIDGQEVTLHVFAAQPQSDQPATRFYQISSVAGQTGYTFTAATPVTTPNDLEASVTEMLKSVTFEEQVEEEGA